MLPFLPRALAGGLDFIFQDSLWTNEPFILKRKLRFLFNTLLAHPFLSLFCHNSHQIAMPALLTVLVVITYQNEVFKSLKQQFSSFFFFFKILFIYF